jgi:hypothetical protein
MGTRASLDDMKRRKILPPPGLELSPLSHPAHSQLLHQLCYHTKYIIYQHCYIKLSRNKNVTIFIVLYITFVTVITQYNESPISMRDNQSEH